MWVPGSWTTMRRWVAGYYETTEVVVVPGHYDTQNTWVTLPHPAPTPNPPPASPPAQTPETGGDCAVPAGIYKVTDYYAGTDVEQTDESIHYLTVTDDRPNDLYAVDLGSYGKGVAGPYDGAASTDATGMSTATCWPAPSIRTTASLMDATSQPASSSSRTIGCC